LTTIESAKYRPIPADTWYRQSIGIGRFFLTKGSASIGIGRFLLSKGSASIGIGRSYQCEVSASIGIGSVMNKGRIGIGRYH
jgi:hypothetical protein